MGRGGGEKGIGESQWVYVVKLSTDPLLFPMMNQSRFTCST